MLRYHFAVMQVPVKKHAGPTAARLFTLILVVALASCSTTGPSWPPQTDQLSDGETLFARDDFPAAARAWQQEALDSEPRRANGLRVRAADAWLLAGQPSEAEDALQWVERRQLAPPDRSRLDLVLADLALRSHQPDEAESLLQSALPNLPASSRNRYDVLQSRVVQQLSIPGSRDISKAARLSETMRYYEPEASVALIRSLENVSSGELAIRADNPRGERQLTGWLDLTLVIRQNLVNPESVTTAAGQWKLRHPYHLLTEQQALDTWLRYRQMFAPPRKVAALLPLTGRLKAAGEAIRDGLMSAYLDNPGGAEILFFATGDDEQSAISAYFNALDAGADWIIGPLRKESVEAVLKLAGMSTPVLALNDLPPGYNPPPGLTGQISGISLSQDREAEAIADHAILNGYQQALVLVPEDTWGDRISAAFKAEFLRENGQIVAASRYLESENDHTAALERVLRIDESEARHKQLENTLQMNLEFEPVRRHDIDVIFLGASSQQARLIRPQLRFHDAGDIPVYATSRIYSGQPDPATNQDLDGIRFPATPWEVSHPTAGDIPDFSSIRKGSRSSLYALGQDAWNLLPWLSLMHKDPDFVFPGQSGYYQSSGSETLRREPAWSMFRGGLPVALWNVVNSENP